MIELHALLEKTATATKNTVNYLEMVIFPEVNALIRKNNSDGIDSSLTQYLKYFNYFDSKRHVL